MTNKDFYKLLGKRIETVRKNRGMSAEDLGDRIDKTKKTIRRYELGDVKVSHDIIAQIANVLDKPVSYFYGNLLDNEKPKEEINEPTKAIAAHIREDATDEEIKAIKNFIDYTFRNRDEN